MLQVDREEASRSVFMKRFKHGAEMEAVRKLIDDIEIIDEDLLYDLEDVSWDFVTMHNFHRVLQFDDRVHRYVLGAPHRYSSGIFFRLESKPSMVTFFS